MTLDAENNQKNDELTRLMRENEKLRSLIGTYEKQEQSFEALLAIISHEIKTPIGALIAMGELLSNTSLSDIQKHYVNTLLFAAEMLTSTTKDMAYFADLKAGQLTFKPEPVNIGDFLSSLALSFAPQAEAKGLEFRATMSRSVPTNLEVDHHRLSQIILNLVNNALKYTNAGSIDMSVSGEPLADDNYRLTIAITDTGIGIPAADQSEIFSPFYMASNVRGNKQQSENQQNTSDESSGLGLWICRQIAHGLNGELTFKSEEGKGSVFTLVFEAKTGAVLQQPETTPPTDEPSGEPVVMQQTAEMTPSTGNQPPAKNEAAKETGPTQPKLKGHVLVVDDNQVNQMLISVYLEEFGLSYQVVSSGQEAIDKVRTNQYDLILMDIMMPGIDGIECARQLQNFWSPETRTPIIAISASDNHNREEIYKEVGIIQHLDKPIDAELFYQSLSDNLPPPASHKDQQPEQTTLSA